MGGIIWDWLSKQSCDGFFIATFTTVYPLISISSPKRRLKNGTDIRRAHSSLGTVSNLGRTTLLTNVGRSAKKWHPAEFRRPKCKNPDRSDQRFNRSGNEKQADDYQEFKLRELSGSLINAQLYSTCVNYARMDFGWNIKKNVLTRSFWNEPVRGHNNSRWNCNTPIPVFAKLIPAPNQTAPVSACWLSIRTHVGYIRTVSELAGKWVILPVHMHASTRVALVCRTHVLNNTVLDHHPRTLHARCKSTVAPHPVIPHAHTHKLSTCFNRMLWLDAHRVLGGVIVCIRACTPGRS